MATLYPSQDATQNWSAAEWSNADDNAQNQAKPSIGDTVIFTANSTAAMTLDENSAAGLASLTMTGYTGTLACGGNFIDVDGNAILDGTILALIGPQINIKCSGDLTLAAGMAIGSTVGILLDGTGTLTTNGVEMGALTFNSAGTHAPQDNIILNGALTYTAGTWTRGTAAITLAASAILSWNTGPSRLYHLIVNNGVTAILAADTKAGKVTNNGAITTATGKALYVQVGEIGWWGSVLGTTSCKLVVRNTTNSPGNDVTLADQDCEVSSTVSHSMAMDGALDIGTGDLAVRSPNADFSVGLDMVKYALTCNNIKLGATAANTGNGQLHLGSGIAKIAGNITEGNAANVGNEVDFDEAYVQLDGDFDGTDFAVNQTADGVAHIEGRGGSTISNIGAGAGSISTVLHTHNCTARGGNDANVTFDEHTPPGSLALMGVGI